MIREAEVTDAETLLHLVKKVEAESRYMLLDPYERTTNMSSMTKRIATFAKEENSIMLVAEEAGELIGYCFASGGQVNRTKHSAYLVIGILKAYRGKGIGSAFFNDIEQWARMKDLHRLELTVVTENEAALGLYRKAGFEIEGVKKHSLRIAGDFKDEYYMAKLL